MPLDHNKIRDYVKICKYNNFDAIEDGIKYGDEIGDTSQLEVLRYMNFHFGINKMKEIYEKYIAETDMIF